MPVTKKTKGKGGGRSWNPTNEDYAYGIAVALLGKKVTPPLLTNAYLRALASLTKSPPGARGRFAFAVSDAINGDDPTFTWIGARCLSGELALGVGEKMFNFLRMDTYGDNDLQTVQLAVGSALYRITRTQGYLEKFTNECPFDPLRAPRDRITLDDLLAFTLSGAAPSRE